MVKSKNIPPDSKAAAQDTDSAANSFYFRTENYKYMIIGLGLIILGFILMMGPDANTVDGKYDPNLWNDGIFSVIRIRIAPLLVMLGFAVEVFAILKRKNFFPKHNASFGEYTKQP